MRAPPLVLAGAGVALAACSPSLLVRDGDPTFARSSARLERTRQAIEAERARAGAGGEGSGADATIFLQAEAFYRYRFDPPPRSFGTYLAQTAAVAIELPALQAVAGSLDLFELRLRMYDGAVQLWETLLARHPRSALRPLALYRLGWAYRSVVSPGFPREEPDEALDELIRDYPGSPLAALALEAKGVPWKSQETATGMSLVPGLGQIYAGEPANGAVRLGVALAALAMIVVPAYVAWQRRDDLTWGRDWPLLATGIGGIIVLSVDYTLAYQDALRAVMQHNERAEAAFEDRHHDAP